MRMKALAASVFVVTLSIPTVVSAAPLPSCYRFEVFDGPESSSAVAIPRAQTWCYEKLSYPAGGTFVYNVDGERVRPELAALIEADGLLTHGSLQGGRVTVHKLHADFNPLAIPLTEPKSVSPEQHGHLLSEKGALIESAREVLRLFLSAPVSFEALAFEEGTMAVTVPESALPWRGYWWPYKGQPLSGSRQSPLAKYDRFVAARTGQNPRAASWENAHHRYKDIWWEGHCNGWAASSIIRKQPSFPRKDPRTGILFTVADQKGILAETDYCVATAFFGERYRGRRGQRLSDIDPVLFHRTLAYFIGEIGKPVGVDYHRDGTVDNHVISGYKLTIKRLASDKLDVINKVNIHKYDNSRAKPPGPAPVYNRTYRYTLQLDEAGTVVSGRWKSTNPDFLWVPLSPMDCDSNNARIDHAMTEAILSLPQAQ